MLVLDMYEGDTVMVGDSITVVFVDHRRGRAKLGFIAPKDVSIDRQSVREKKEWSKGRGFFNVDTPLGFIRKIAKWLEGMRDSAEMSSADYELYRSVLVEAQSVLAAAELEAVQAKGVTS